VKRVIVWNSLIEEQELLIASGGGDFLVEQLDTVEAATMANAPFAAGSFDENAAHGLGGGREEVAATVPALLRLGADEPQIGLVDQGGRLKRLPLLLLN
jgi:hypothetical protein